MTEEGSTKNVARLVADAIVVLQGVRHRIADAIDHVPNAPGLHAVYGDESSIRQLDVTTRSDGLLYVGKAERSLAARDLRTHFASGRTGSSTVRRSFAALLRDELNLRGVPRNQAKPERPANFGLEPDNDRILTEWMHEHLSLATWTKPPGDESLDAIESEVIAAWQPPLNLDKVERRLPALVAARRRMADGARTWALKRDFDL